jgi:hypothetical protein
VRRPGADPERQGRVPSGAHDPAGTAAISVTCDLDCSIAARLEKLPRHSTTLAVRASGRIGERTVVKFPPTPIARCRYRFTVSLSAPVNRGEPRLLASKAPIVR